MLLNIQQLNKNVQPNRKISLFAQISQQVQYWQQLSRFIQPLLPQPEQWQVVCYQAGKLTLSGYNQVMVSQLNYLHQHYVHVLSSQLSEFNDLHSIKAILLPLEIKKEQQSIDSIPAESRRHFALAAECVENPALKEALKRLSQYTPKE